VLEGRTAIIVAHRLSTAMRAHRIAVVDDGRIIELGSHDELVAIPGGRYADMFAAWMSHLETDTDTGPDEPSGGAPEVVGRGTTG
jgi:ATP-binding cassette subfamily B protein